jgi:hypothetical protein
MVPEVAGAARGGEGDVFLFATGKVGNGERRRAIHHGGDRDGLALTPSHVHVTNLTPPGVPALPWRARRPILSSSP